MKDVLSNFFVESYVNTTPTHYYSGVELKTATCDNTDVAEVGFVGRTLLNAFNALEYGSQQNRPELVNSANSIFDTYLTNGFSPAGFFNEVVHYNRDFKVSAANRKVCMLFLIIWITRSNTSVNILNGRNV